MVHEQGKTKAVKALVSDDLADRIETVVAQDPELTESQLIRQGLRNQLEAHE